MIASKKLPSVCLLGCGVFCDGKYLSENLSSLSDGELSTFVGHAVKWSVNVC